MRLDAIEVKITPSFKNDPYNYYEVRLRISYPNGPDSYFKERIEKDSFLSEFEQFMKHATRVIREKFNNNEQ